MKNRLILLKSIALVASLSLLGISWTPLHGKAPKAAAKGNNKKGDAPTAASLVDDMKASVIYIVKNAKDINPKSKQALPFWSSLKTTIEGIDLMDKGIKAKSPDMLKGLNNVGGGVTELSATWGIIRGAHPKSTVGRGVVSLSKAYDMYVGHFGPSVAAMKKGGKKGKLTDAELAMIEKSGVQLEGLLGNLEKVAAKAKPKSYQSRMVQDLLGLIEQLTDIEGEDRGAYAKYQYQWNRLQNALGAYGNITKAYYPDYYKSSWSVMSPLTSAMNSLFYTDAWSYYENWDYSSVSIANYSNYYEETSITESITETEETTYEESLESYSEESATEEDAECEAEIDEEVEDAEDDEDSLFEEVEDSDCDSDGDGVEDDEDTDDDNDGVSDEEDTDDDGDGLSDEEDDDEEEDDEEMDEDEDDDGVADCCEGCCE